MFETGCLFAHTQHAIDETWSGGDLSSLQQRTMQVNPKGGKVRQLPIADETGGRTVCAAGIISEGVGEESGMRRCARSP